METITDFINYFNVKLSNFKRDTTEVYGIDDLRQESAKLICEFYDKATSEDSTNPIGYLGKTIFCRLRTFRCKNKPMVKIEDIECIAASGGFNYNLDLCLDIDDFCERYDKYGLINLKLKGFNLKEISSILNVAYPEIIKYNRWIKEKLTVFLEI